MARIARRGLRLNNLPLFSLDESWRKVSNQSGELLLNLFEPRYVELARRIESAEGSNRFGYASVFERRAHGSGVLVETGELDWMSKDGPIQLAARGIERFRVVSIRKETIKDGMPPLFLANVQLLVDRDLSRVPATRLNKSSHAHQSPSSNTIFGKVFAQHGGWGFASYHFQPNGSYISYESALCKTFPPLDDGSQPPPKKMFENVSYDHQKRTFSGSVTWNPSWQGADRWDYDIIFSSDFNAIVGGAVRWHMKDPEGHDKQNISRYGVHLHYTQFRMGIDSSESAIKDVLLQSGISPSDVEESLRREGTLAQDQEDPKGMTTSTKVFMRHRNRMRRALKVISCDRNSLGPRLAAIDVLAELAPQMQKAEDALHRVLQTTSGNDVDEIRNAAEAGLWASWHQAGDAEIDAEFKRGTTLLSKQRIDDAIVSFTKIIERAPHFAEGWNKRATALCALGKFNEAIEDCKRTVELKPRHFGCLSGLAMCHFARGDKQEAMNWLQDALKVHPGLRGANEMYERIRIQDLIDKHLQPIMDRIVDAYKKTEFLHAGASESCSWDVHRINLDQNDGGWAYFFRVRICNPITNVISLQSCARFYVLQGVNGKVFPFARPTQGDASFRLEPGQEHKFCWSLRVRSELQGAVAGALLERCQESCDDTRFVAEEMTPLLMIGCPEIEESRVASLAEGYKYTGQLDLRSADEL